MKTITLFIIFLVMVGLPLYAKSDMPVAGQGVIVINVTHGSPADKAGLLENDILLAADNEPLQFYDTIERINQQRLVAQKKSISIRYKRNDVEHTIDMSVSADPGCMSRPHLSVSGEQALSQIQNLSRSEVVEHLIPLAEQTELEKDLRGAAWMWQLIIKLSASTDSRASHAAEKMASLSEKTGDEYGAAAGLLAQSLCAKDNKKAIEYSRKAAVKLKKIVPGSLDQAIVFFNLGNFLCIDKAWDDALTCYQNALGIRASLLPDSRETAVCAFKIGSILQKKGEPAKAKTYYLQALEIENRIDPDSLQVGTIKDNIGSVLEDISDFEGAMQYYQQAYEIRQKLLPDSLEIVSSLNNIGKIFLQQGNIAEAKARFSQALEIALKIDPQCLGVANSLSNLGLVEEDQGDLSAAITHFEQALAINRKIDPVSEHTSVILSNLGLAKDRIGDIEGAKIALEEALKTSKAIYPDNLNTAACLNNFSNVLYHQGYLSQAKECQLQSLAIERKISPHSLAVSYSLNNLANIACDQSDYTEAERLLHEALEIRQKLAPDSLAVASCLSNLGGLASDEGDFDKALDYYKQAYFIQKKLVPDGPDVANTLHNIGCVSYDLGKVDEAKDYLKKCLSIKEKISTNSMAVAVTLSMLGVISLDEQTYKEADTYFTRSLAISEKVSLENMHTVTTLVNLGILANVQGDTVKALDYYNKALPIIKSHNDLFLLWNVQYFIGSIYKHRGDTDKALQYFKDAVSTFESIRYTGKEAKERVIQTKKGPANLYNDLLQLLLDLNKQDEALEYLERFKSKTVLDSLSLRSIVIKDPRLSDLLKRYDEIHSEMTVRRHDLDEEQSKPADKRSTIKIDQLTKLLAKTKAEFYQTINDIRKTYGVEYSSLVQVEPTEFSQVQKVLPADTVIVEYFPAADKLYCFLITRDRFEIVEHAVKRDDLDAWVTEVRDAMKAWQSGMGEKETPPALFQLYDHLIKPIEQKIASYKTVIVAPSGTLWYLPFSALASRDGSNNIHYLVERDQQFITLTQIGLLGKLLENNKASSVKRTVDIAAFGNPSGIKPALPQSEAEVGEIAHYYKKSDVFTGRDASKAKVIDEAQRCRILHFATHGSLQHDDPNQSCLSMAVSTTDDGLLTQGEIFGLPLDGSRLVVLSACETALAEENPGRELSSLSQAFTIAGAPSVIASLWSVNDASTNGLMSVFYRELASGKSKSQALQTSQRELLHDEKYNHPYFWAAFELFGAWE